MNATRHVKKGSLIRHAPSIKGKGGDVLRGWGSYKTWSSKGGVDNAHKSLKSGGKDWQLSTSGGNWTTREKNGGRNLWEKSSIGSGNGRGDSGQSVLPRNIQAGVLGEGAE